MNPGLLPQIVRLIWSGVKTHHSDPIPPLSLQVSPRALSLGPFSSSHTSFPWSIFSINLISISTASQMTHSSTSLVNQSPHSHPPPSPTAYLKLNTDHFIPISITAPGLHLPPSQHHLVCLQCECKWHISLSFAVFFFPCSVFFHSWSWRCPSALPNWTESFGLSQCENTLRNNERICFSKYFGSVRIRSALCYNCWMLDLVRVLKLPQLSSAYWYFILIFFCRPPLFLYQSWHWAALPRTAGMLSATHWCSRAQLRGPARVSLESG